MSAKSRSAGAPAKGPEPLRRAEEAVSQKRVNSAASVVTSWVCLRVMVWSPRMSYCMLKLRYRS